MFFYLMQVAGTICFAISGALAAYKKNFDLVGVLLIAFAVGNGGGTLRDILLGATPVFWVEAPINVTLTLITGLIVFFWAKWFNVNHRAFLIADAIGLGVFAIVGAQKTLHMGLSPFIAILMGGLTAVGGGVIRDILSARPPLIFEPEIYATAALCGASVFVLSHQYWPHHNPLAGLACILTVIGLRLATLYWHWTLPTPAWLDNKRQGSSPSEH